MNRPPVAERYTRLEMMFVAAAREVAGRGGLFVGMSYPLLAATDWPQTIPSIFFTPKGSI